MPPSNNGKLSVFRGVQLIRETRSSAVAVMGALARLRAAQVVVHDQKKH
jgi:hypothetical protein